MLPPSSPKKQTQSKPVLSAVEWANFFKGQNRLLKNPATPYAIGSGKKTVINRPPLL